MPIPILTAIDPQLTWRREETDTYRIAADARLMGRPGFLHGGAISAMFDLAARRTLCALLSAAQVRYRALDIGIEYLRGGALADTWVEMSVVRRGSRIVNLAGLAWQDKRDRPIASCRMMFTLEREG